jgi:hypothetical protein
MAVSAKRKINEGNANKKLKQAHIRVWIRSKGSEQALKEKRTLSLLNALARTQKSIS